MHKLYVRPAGPPNARIAICGEQVALHEVRHRPPTPFVGPAGQELDACLRMAKINRQDCWVTNVIKDLDASLGHYIYVDDKNNYTIHSDGREYIQELKEELQQLKPNVVVATGNIPLIALCDRAGITKWRGSVIESTLIPGLKVIPTFHPATVIPPKRNWLNKPLIVFDLNRAREESLSPSFNHTERNIKIRPSFSECIGMLDYVYEAGAHGATIDIDIEVINEQLNCIAFAWTPTDAFCIPFIDSHGDYFTIDQEHHLMLLIAKIITSPLISKRGANFIFDMQWMFKHYGIVPRGNLQCTQIAQKILLPDYPAGLDFVTCLHTDIPYYKADGKKWMKAGIGTWETWWTYNGQDAITTAAAFPSQLNDLTKQGNLPTYERQKAVIYPLIYMSEHGIKVDVQGIISQKEKEKKQLEELEKQAKQIIGRDINLNSSQQLAHYFYKELKHPAYKKRNAKGESTITTNVDALKRLARKGVEVAQIMLKVRGLSKRISTYLNINKVDKDGRYRSAYKPVGAETGRLSSGETIDGSGGNQQNWPHDLLQYFLFDEGYIGYSIDLSQVENRLVAYIGNITQMIKAFEDGTDVHTLTASLIFNKPPDQITREDGTCYLGDGSHSERFWGKKANHGLNYDLGYKTFALYYELPESEAKMIVDRYHSAYPGVRQNYHAMVQSALIHNRILTNCFGRKRLFMGPVVPNPSQGIKLADCHVTYKEAYAHIPQSTTADKINEHGLNYIYYNQHLFKPLELLTQVHDSIVFQIPLSVPWIEHARMLKLIKDSLEQPIYWHDIEIRIPADLAIGFNMYKEQMKEIKSKKFPNDLNQLADRLKEIHDELKQEASRLD